MKNKIYEHTLHPLFLAGFILLAIGTITQGIINVSPGAIFAIVISALPLIGLMKIYLAARSVAANTAVDEEYTDPKDPGGLLEGISFIRTVAIIYTVLFSILLALTVLVTFTSTIALAGVDTGLAFGMLAIGAVGCTIIGAVIYFYCVAQLRIYKGLREGIYTDEIKPLRGVMPLTVMAVLSILSSFVMHLGIVQDAVVSMMEQAAANIEGEFGEIMRDAMDEALWAFAPAEPLAIPIVLDLLPAIGTILLLISLNRFNNSLKEDTPPCNGLLSE